MTDYQPMKIAATEALWDTEQPASFSLFQIGGFTRGATRRRRSRSRSRSLLSFLATGSLQRPGRGDQRAPEAGRAAVRARQLHPARRRVYWGMRIMAYLGTLVFLVSLVGRLPLPARRLERTRWFLWVGVADDPAPVPRGARGLGAHRGRPPALDRAGPAEDGGRQLAERRRPATIGTSLARLRRPLRRLLRRRLRAHAPLRARRPARGRRRRGRVATPGGGLLMDLETFWFCLIAVLWAGYFLLEGFDFGVGMLLAVRPARRARSGARCSRRSARLGRERGLARRRRRRDVRGVPGLVRDDVLGLLPRAAAHPRLPHRPGRLVRVAREERDARAGGRPGRGRTRSAASGAPLLWGVALASLVSRRADRLERHFAGDLLRPLQPLHASSPGSPSSRSSRSTARSS